MFTFASGPVSGPSRRRRGFKKPLSVLLAAVLAGLLWVAYVQWLIHSVQGRELDTRTEVAIVLGAALWNDRPSPGLSERLNQAYELYIQDKIERIIVSGGLDANGASITEAEGMKRYLTEKGVPADRIVEEREATSTYENLLFSKRIMDREGWTKAVIVTHEYHGARSIDIAEYVGLQDACVSLTDSRVMWMPWHKARETLAFTKWFADKLLLKSGLKSLS